jgi:hypothetical protein
MPIEQRFHYLVGAAALQRVADQAMGVERVGLDADAIEGEIDADGGADLGDLAATPSGRASRISRRRIRPRERRRPACRD